MAPQAWTPAIQTNNKPIIDMRLEGMIRSWNDARGFGFIRPASGGEDVFVHIKAFDAPALRPQVGQQVTFEVERGPEGKARAKWVRPRNAPAHVKAGKPGERWNRGGWFALPLFALLYLGVDLVWRVPPWVAGLYAVASLVTWIAYWADKAAARAGGWRVKESTLLMFGLAGGWPGAILAQIGLRHKSSKVSFRRRFWATVFVNVGMFLTLASPWAAPVWAKVQPFWKAILAALR